MTYRNPGLLFLQSHGEVESEEDVFEYVEFLRQESGVGNYLPVDINQILKYFDFPIPKIRKLPNIQGLLIDQNNGIIIINAEDIPSRQKFSLAHELVEVLFNLPYNDNKRSTIWTPRTMGGFKESKKENICNKAAANLLMPRNYVVEQTTNLGLCFDCAREISKCCEISLSAALVQMVRFSEGINSVILWKMKNKPTDFQKKIPENQMAFFTDIKTIADKKLRVEWAFSNETGVFIPKDKSVNEESHIYTAWKTKNFTLGSEFIQFSKNASFLFFTENLPFTTNGETQVLSLLRSKNKQSEYHQSIIS